MNKATTILSAALLSILAAGCDMQNGGDFQTNMPKYEWKTLPGESLPRLVRVEDKPAAAQPAPLPAPTATTTPSAPPTPRPAVTTTTAKPSGKNDAFDGNNLRVYLNDFRAAKIRTQDGEPIYSAPPTEGDTVYFKFEFQRPILGDLTAIRISIYPMVNNKTSACFYKPILKTVLSKTTYPLTPLKYFGPDGIRDFKSLPKGKYLMRLRVSGKDSFEQQTIEFEVR